MSSKTVRSEMFTRQGTILYKNHPIQYWFFVLYSRIACTVSLPSLDLRTMSRHIKLKNLFHSSKLESCPESFKFLIKKKNLLQIYGIYLIDLIENERSPKSSNKYWKIIHLFTLRMVQNDICDDSLEFYDWLFEYWVSQNFPLQLSMEQSNVLTFAGHSDQSESITGMQYALAYNFIATFIKIFDLSRIKWNFVYRDVSDGNYWRIYTKSMA